MKNILIIVTLFSITVMAGCMTLGTTKYSGRYPVFLGKITSISGTDLSNKFIEIQRLESGEQFSRSTEYSSNISTTEVTETTNVRFFWYDLDEMADHGYIAANVEDSFYYFVLGFHFSRGTSSTYMINHTDMPIQSKDRK